jgi:hypothetical protein
MLLSASRPSAMALSLLLVSLAATGCSASQAGFYTIRKVPVAPLTVPAETRPNNNNAAPASPSDYLTITAHADFSQLQAANHSKAAAFQMLRLDLAFDDQVNGHQFRAPLLAYNLKSGYEFKTIGWDVLKGYPIRPNANSRTDLSLTSKAVEKNKVDIFLEAFSAVRAIASAVPAASGLISSPAAKVLDEGAKYLERFSSAAGTESTATFTLNSPQYARTTPQALLLVPTNGKKPDVAQRLAAVETTEYKVCGTDVAPKLCRVVNQQTLPVDYAYVLLLPTASYRISSPQFLSEDAPCTLTRDRLAAHAATVHAYDKMLTSDQRSAEDELHTSATTLLTVRDAIAQLSFDRAFTAINEEFARPNPQTPLFHMATPNFTPYATTQTKLRDCLIATADASRPGLFRTYRRLLDLVYVSDQPTSVQDRRARHNAIIRLTSGVASSINAFNITAPYTTALLAAHKKLAEDEIWDIDFQQPINRLNAAQSRDDRAAAKLDVTRLLTSECQSCVEKARRALDTADAVDAAERRALEVVAALAADRSSLLGAFEVARETSIATRDPLSANLAADVQQHAVDLQDAARLIVQQPASRDRIERANDLTERSRELHDRIDRDITQTDRPPQR